MEKYLHEKKIFVTGGKGYIGSLLVRKLSAMLGSNNIKIYDVVDGDDILDLYNLSETMKSFKPDVVIHMAAISLVASCNDDIKATLTCNGVGTRNVLSAMKLSGCKNILYTSTSGVYSFETSSMKHEDSHIDPSSVYGLSKLLGEHAVENHYYHEVGNFLIYRLFNVIGTSGHRDIDNINFSQNRLFSALDSGKITIYGDDYHTKDGTCVRDYVALKDVCNAICCGLVMLFKSTHLREVVNIASGKTYSVRQIVNRWNKISRRLSSHNNTTLKQTEVHKLAPKSLTKSLSSPKTSRSLKDSQRDTLRKRAIINNKYGSNSDSIDPTMSFASKSSLRTVKLPHVDIIYGDRREGDPEIISASVDKAHRLLKWKTTKNLKNIIMEHAHDKS